MTKAERNQRLDGVLAGLIDMRGVVTAAVIDNDGFVLHIRREFEVDTDALGAAVQVVMASATRAGEQVRQGAVKLLHVETREGLMMIGPLTRGFSLVLVADATAMLGAVRFELKSAIPELDRLFAS